MYAEIPTKTDPTKNLQFLLQNCISFEYTMQYIFINSISIPATGPKAKPPTSAGMSLISICKNLGI